MTRKTYNKVEIWNGKHILHPEDTEKQKKAIKKRYKGENIELLEVPNAFIVLDTEDYNPIKYITWHLHKGRYRKYEGNQLICIANVILNLPKETEVYYINGDYLDNRKINLKFK
jgi:hypothetical protein